MHCQELNTECLRVSYPAGNIPDVGFSFQLGGGGGSLD